MLPSAKPAKLVRRKTVQPLPLPRFRIMPIIALVRPVAEILLPNIGWTVVKQIIVSKGKFVYPISALLVQKQAAPVLKSKLAQLKPIMEPRVILAEQSLAAMF